MASRVVPWGAGGGGSSYRGRWKPDTVYPIGDTVSWGEPSTYEWAEQPVYATTSHTRYAHAVITSIDSSNSTHVGILVQPATSYSAMHGAAGNDWRIILGAGNGTLSLVVNATLKTIAVSNIAPTTTLTAVAALINANANLTAQVLPWSEGTYRPVTGTYKFTGGDNQSYDPITGSQAVANIGSAAVQASHGLGAVQASAAFSSEAQTITITIGSSLAVGAAGNAWQILWVADNTRPQSQAPTLVVDSTARTLTVTARFDGVTSGTRLETIASAINGLTGWSATNAGGSGRGFSATPANTNLSGGGPGVSMAVRSARAAGAASNNYRVLFQRGTQPFSALQAKRGLAVTGNSQATATLTLANNVITITLPEADGFGAAGNAWRVTFSTGATTNATRNASTQTLNIQVGTVTTASTLVNVINTAMGAGTASYTGTNSSYNQGDVTGLGTISFTGGSDGTSAADLTVRNISGQQGAASNNFLVKFERGNQVVAAVKAAASIRGSGSFDTVGVDATVDAAGTGGNAYSIVIQGSSNAGASASISSNTITLNLYNGTTLGSAATQTQVAAALSGITGITATAVGASVNMTLSEWGGARTINFSGGVNAVADNSGTSLATAGGKTTVTITYKHAQGAMTVNSNGQLTDGTNTVPGIGDSGNNVYFEASGSGTVQVSDLPTTATAFYGGRDAVVGTSGATVAVSAGISTVTVVYKYAQGAMTVNASGQLTDGTNSLPGIGNTSTDYFQASGTGTVAVADLPTTATALTGGKDDTRGVLTLDSDVAIGTDGNRWDALFELDTAAKASVTLTGTISALGSVTATVDAAGAAGNSYTINIVGSSNDGASATISGTTITLNIYDGTLGNHYASRTDIASALNGLAGISATGSGGTSVGNLAGWRGARTVNFSGGVDGGGPGASSDSATERVTIAYDPAVTTISIGTNGALNDGTSDLANTGTGTGGLVSLAKHASNSVATYSITVAELVASNPYAFAGGVDTSDGDFHSLFGSTAQQAPWEQPLTITWASDTDDHRFIAVPHGVVFTLVRGSTNMLGSGSGQFAKLANNRELSAGHFYDIFRATNVSGFAAGTYALTVTGGVTPDATPRGRLWLSNLENENVEPGFDAAGSVWTGVGDVGTVINPDWEPEGVAWCPPGIPDIPDSDGGMLLTSKLGIAHRQIFDGVTGSRYTRWSGYWYNGYSQVASPTIGDAISNLLEASPTHISSFVNGVTNPPETLSSGDHGICARFGDIIVAVYRRGTAVKRAHATVQSDGTLGSWTTTVGANASMPSGVRTMGDVYSVIEPGLPYYFEGDIGERGSAPGIDAVGGLAYCDGGAVTLYSIDSSSPYGLVASRSTLGETLPRSYSTWTLQTGGGTGSVTVVAGPRGYKGDAGIKGDAGESIKGDKGSKGDAGSASAKGEKGDSGSSIKGDKGSKGDAGESVKGDPGESVKGSKGDSGSGSKGDKGDAGASVKGSKGDAGSASAKGDKGDAGSSVKGDKGDAGSSVKGDKGDAGSSVKGSKGDAGSGGIKGSKGDAGSSVKGSKGDPGSASAKGDKGDAGSSIKGDKGSKGDAGESVKGDKGAAGSASAKGEKGDAGSSVKGDKGDAGASVKGSKGDSGSGSKGDKGDAGSSVKGDKGDDGSRMYEAASAWPSNPRPGDYAIATADFYAHHQIYELRRRYEASSSSWANGDFIVYGSNNNDLSISVGAGDLDALPWSPASAFGFSIFHTVGSQLFFEDTTDGSLQVATYPSSSVSSSAGEVYGVDSVGVDFTQEVSPFGTFVDERIYRLRVVQSAQVRSGELYQFHGDGTSGYWAIAVDLEGAKGDAGASVKGSKGDSGAGSKGDKGDAGSGSKGDKGDDGSSVKGDKGDAGSSVKGDKGDAGSGGIKGSKGDAGSSVKGSKGDAGSSVKGDKGDAGASVKGSKGDAGSAGIKGSKGDEGGHLRYGKTLVADGSVTLEAEGYWADVGSVTIANVESDGEILLQMAGSLQSGETGEKLGIRWVRGTTTIETADPAFQEGEIKAQLVAFDAVDSSPATGSNTYKLQMKQQLGGVHTGDMTLIWKGVVLTAIDLTSGGGSDGDKGDKGVKGEKGSSGGVKGDKGDAGASVKGSKGDDGSSVKGDKGDAGSSVKGDKGDAGSSVKGDKGDAGSGSKGDKGDAGSSVKGSKGDAGSSVKGSKGDAGSSVKGDKGDAGSSVKGEKGDSGSGSKGDKGDAGSSVKGDKGDAGASVKGNKGDAGSGSKGDAGSKGSKGDDGSSIKGSKGDAGSNASAGVTVQDEGTALATLGTTLNFVGALVTATGTGAVKTITIQASGTGGSHTRWCGISDDSTITAAELTQSSTSSTITLPTWASGQKYLVFALPTNESDFTDLREQGAFENQLDIFTKQSGTLTKNGETLKYWVSDSTVFQSNSGTIWVMKQ